MASEWRSQVLKGQLCIAGAWGTPQMPVYNDPTPSIVGRELLGPQMGRKVTQGLPDFDPVAFLENARTRAEAPTSEVLSDESSLPDEEEPAPLLDLSSMSAVEQLCTKVPGRILIGSCLLIRCACSTGLLSSLLVDIA